MNIMLIEKSSKGTKFNLYSDGLALMESEMFDDLSSLNFHLQTLAKKLGIEKGLLVVHDRDRNTVSLSVALEENSFFVS